MIDCHTHIMPGFDDGPETMEESLAMVRMAAREGVSKMVATPHYSPPHFANVGFDETLEHLNRMIKAEGVSMEVFAGNEATLDESLPEALLDGLCKTLGTSRAVLVELPTLKIYPVHEQLLYKLRMNGYRVVLAHVDRYDYFAESPDLLQTLIDQGCASQINASAITERSTSSHALKWIRMGLVHVVASDCHGEARRRPRLKEAYERVTSELGFDVAEDLFKQNGNRILNDEPIVGSWGSMRKEKRLLNRWNDFFRK